MNLKNKSYKTDFQIKLILNVFVSKWQQTLKCTHSMLYIEW